MLMKLKTIPITITCCSFNHKLCEMSATWFSSSSSSRSIDLSIQRQTQNPAEPRGLWSTRSTDSETLCSDEFSIGRHLEIRDWLCCSVVSYPSYLWNEEKRLNFDCFYLYCTRYPVPVKWVNIFRLNLFCWPPYEIVLRRAGLIAPVLHFNTSVFDNNNECHFLEPLICVCWSYC